MILVLSILLSLLSVKNGTTEAFASSLRDIGLTASCLVVAGFEPNDVSRIEVRWNDAVAQRAAMQTAVQRESDARVAVRTVKSDPDATVAELKSAETDLCEKADQLNVARNELRAVVLDGEDAEKIAIIQNWLNCTVAQMPAQYRVIEHTQEDAERIMQDLNSEKRAARLGVPVDPEVANRLRQLRSEPRISAAVHLLNEHLSGMKQALSNEQ